MSIQTSFLIQIPNYSASIKSTDNEERTDYIYEIFKGLKSHIHLCNNDSKLLLFSKIKNISLFKYRQIVQFLAMERNKNGFMYNLDVLKMFLNSNLCIGDTIDDFIKRYIKDDSKDKCLLLSPH